MLWLGGVALLCVAQAVHAIQNSTSYVVRNDGWKVYPCYQVNHREPEFETAVLGLWYVIETIEHRYEPNIEGIYRSNKCTKINLFKTSPIDVKLVWQEKEGDIHYTFQMTDPENAGFWLAWGRQTGTMIDKHHKQFEGSVQVLEAEPSRMVLTFCSLNHTHYSVIMVRNISVVHDTEPTRRMLASFGLSQVRVTQSCLDAQDSAVSATMPTSLVLASSLLLITRLN